MGYGVMEYATRSHWGALSPRKPWTWLKPSRVQGIVIHHSGVKDGPTGVAAVQAFERHHMQVRKWSSIAYNWLVDVDGTIYEGRQKGAVGGATRGWNFRTEAVCYIGDGDEPLSPEAMKGFVVVTNYLHDIYGGKLWVKSHKDFAATSCPGDSLYGWVQSGMSIPVSPGAVPEPVDWEELIRFFYAVGHLLVAHPLKRGARGSVVRLVQEALVRKGFKPGPIDGVFGWRTKRAVQGFQRSRGFGKANGVVAKATWDALFIE